MEKIEKYHRVIAAVGQEYTKWFYDNAVPSVSGKPILNGEGILTKEEFINKIKTDPKFSEKWRLHIEERELSLEERYKLANINGRKERLLGEPYYTDEQQHSLLDELVPTKLITLTYNNQTIETYE